MIGEIKSIVQFNINITLEKSNIRTKSEFNSRMEYDILNISFVLAISCVIISSGLMCIAPASGEDTCTVDDILIDQNS